MAAGGAGPTTLAGDPDPSPSSDAAPLLAVLGLVALALCVAISVAAVTWRREEAYDARAQAAAEREAGSIAVQLQQLESAVENVDPSACQEPVDPAVAVLAFACVDLDDEAIEGAEDLGPLLDEPGVRSVLGQTRDRTTAVLSAPVGSDPPVAVVAAALYDTGGAELSREPSERSVSTQREEVAGYVVAVVDMAELVASADGRVGISDAGVTLIMPQMTGRSAEAEVAALGRRWTVTALIDSPTWWRPLALSIVALGVLAAVLLGLADRQRRRAMQARAAEAHRARQRSEAIRTLAGVVQQSQDLDEILPSLAVQLTDELHLAGLSLAVATGQSREREVFVHGVAPDRSVRRTSGRPVELAAGHTLALDLHRADRSIGTLRVVAGEPLGLAETDLIEVAGEMITSTVVAARSLEQQQEAVIRLEALDELKTTFLGVASHELRTPATAISGLATLLAQRWDALPEPDRHAFAQRIATNADSLNALVQDLLDFARLERGDLELVLAPLDLSATVDAVLTRLDGVWGANGVVRDIQPDVPVLGDVNAIERIVTNLVSNAVKFSPEGAPVTVRVERASGRARLVVDDRGPGVPVEERAKIFARFFRGAGDAIVRTRGVGIGLSVVQDFVGQMGGTVRVEDSPEGGARFVVELAEHDARRLEERDVATT